jgi:hypothetical protein
MTKPEEEKLKNDWLNYIYSICMNEGTNESKVHTNPDKLADYWIEKIKQSNLALLEEVEEDMIGLNNIFEKIRLKEYERIDESLEQKVYYPHAQVLSDFGLNVIHKILSTLSKHKERLSEK